MTKKKRQEKREKNKLRLRHLWPLMTENERKDLCKQTLPDYMLSANFWQRSWGQIPVIWKGQIGQLQIPRHAGLEIADRQKA